jgi:penicillin-binding protein 1C
MKIELLLIHRKIGRWFRRHCRAVAATTAVFVIACATVLLWPMDVSPYLRVTPSGEMQDRSGRLLYAFLNNEEQWCFPRPLSEISPHLVRATIAAEDQRFRRHWGVDPAAVARAAWQAVSRRRVVSGASTLSMQVVKRAEKTPRSLWGKLRQAVQAVRLDARVEKERILETYLNTAPYGLNLVGCEAAARRFFGKPASELTLAEAALLAGLPKAPTSLMPLKADGQAAVRRRNYVLARMREEGFIAEADYRRALDEPARASWHAYPALSPHLAMELKPVILKGRRVRTTLDRNVQAAAERMVRRALDANRGEITNAAVIVLDAPTATVLARVGSASFDDTPGGGQVDACLAPRSPGSALKPFTYATAIERNRLYACEMLQDSLLDYGLYEPENYDRRYRGLVSATTALRLSLNVPAVTVLERVGYERVYALLKRAGLSTLAKPARHYGLGLTLGSCEVKLEELAAAYCMLSNLGEYRPLRVIAQFGVHASACDLPDTLKCELRTGLPDTRELRTADCLSRGTCLALYRMLEQPLPEELGAESVPAAGVVRRVCWKTGTSTGHHDAWAFAFNRQYVVGVWMGNNDGRPSNRLVGATAALPLAARVFRSLPLRNDPAWPDIERDLRAVRVCASSGLPASPWCRQAREELLPRGQYLNRVCDVHYPLKAHELADALEASSATASHERGRAAAFTLERWPGAAHGWDLAKIVSAKRPAGGGGERTARIEGLRIVSPADRAEYVLTGELQGDRIRLKSSVDERTAVHWYIDDRYVGASGPDQALLLDLEPGEHKAVCMTPEGSTDQVKFQVVPPGEQVRFKN